VRGATSVTAALDTLAAGARAILGRALESHELESFARYLRLLQKWQRVHRLVGSIEPEWVVENLFLDSLLFLRVLPAGATSAADIGSGAGFPGIPIGIVRPGMQVALIESRRRRASFLSEVVRDLGLTGVRVLGGRVESFVDEVAGSFDVAVMRCAGGPEELLPIASRLVVPGGRIVLSGPPSPGVLPGVEWVEVPGVRSGRTRRFGVCLVRAEV
jgi:16S rRNA (guanine527-N7)-methyltransferase